MSWLSSLPVGRLQSNFWGFYGQKTAKMWSGPREILAGGRLIRIGSWCWALAAAPKYPKKLSFDPVFWEDQVERDSPEALMAKYAVNP